MALISMASGIPLRPGDHEFEPEAITAVFSDGNPDNITCTTKIDGSSDPISFNVVESGVELVFDPPSYDTALIRTKDRIGHIPLKLEYGGSISSNWDSPASPDFQPDLANTT